MRHGDFWQLTATVRSMTDFRERALSLHPSSLRKVRAQCQSPCIPASAKSNPTCPDRVMDREMGGLASLGRVGRKITCQLQGFGAGRFDGWLTPNVRLEMPSDVKRYNALLPTKTYLRI